MAHVPFVTALDSTSNDSYGVWKIDDKDSSFLTQPFRIKYARQDVRLCMMVSFTMPLERYEVPVFLSFFLGILFICILTTMKANTEK